MSIVNHAWLSDRCDPLAAGPSALAKSPGNPVIRVRLKSLLSPSPWTPHGDTGGKLFLARQAYGIGQDAGKAAARRKTAALVETAGRGLQRGKRGTRDAESGSSARSRKQPSFPDVRDGLAATDGRTPGPGNPAHRGSSHRIMVYWSLARAGLRLTPGKAAFHAAGPGPCGGEHTKCQAKC